MYTKDFHGRPVSALGLGGLRFPTVEGDKNTIDRIEGQKIVDAAMAAGINYFDTAYSYQKGDSERFLGEALRKYPRESYMLATKFYVAYTTDIEATFDMQLARCGVDYFDVYMLHCLDESTIDAYMDEERGYVAFLRKQKELGRVKHIGFSSHAAPETLARFLDWFDGFDMALIQLNYVDWTHLRAKEQYEILTAHGIPVWVMEGLKGGRLSSLSEDSAKILREYAPEKSLSSWGLRFLQGLPNVQTVLSGMSSVDQVRENAQTFARYNPLSQEELNVLWRAKDVFMEALGAPCSACRYCCDTCPAELNIPLLIQGYNEKRISGATWKIEGLDSAKGAQHCLQCGACASRCPQKIDIPAIMRTISGNE